MPERPSVRSLLERVDHFQQRVRPLAVACATLRKFNEDRAGTLAASIAFYGFFSLFPLLLVLVTVAGFVLQSDPELRDAVVSSAVRQFPVVGSDIERNVHALNGSLPVLVIGIAGALWSGLGVVGATQLALNEVWDVPLRSRDGFVRTRLRSLLVLVTLGSATVAAAVVASAGTWLPGALSSGVGFLGAAAINVVVFAVVFRVLTAANVSWRDVVPGAVLAGIVWAALQSLGTYLLESRVRGASDLYGFFGVVLGLLTWMYLAAQLSLFAAELNVVLRERLWPRSMFPPPLRDEDRETLVRQAKETEAQQGEQVAVRFHEPAGTDRSPADRPGEV
jgi:YihY family inner membrane protein